MKLVMEILLIKLAQKILVGMQVGVDVNQLKKLMQVGVDVKCMHTNFSWCGLYGFRDIVTFQNGQISLLNHGL